MNKPDIVLRAEKIMGFAKPVSRPCVKCQTTLNYWEYALHLDWGPSLCDQCGEVVRVQKVEENIKTVKNDLADECLVEAKYRIWDPEKAKSLGNDKLLEYTRENRDESAYVYGSNGSGKSHCAGYAAYRMTDHFKKTKFYKIGKWLDNAISLKFSGKNKEYEELEAEASNCDILVLDDIDKIDVTEAKAKLLYDIIDFRDCKNKPIWVTSNIKLSDLVSRLGDIYGPAIVERIRRMVGDNVIQTVKPKEEN